MALRRRLIDIGANLTDSMFKGIYNGSKKHEEDLEDILHRAKSAGVEKIIVTGGSLEDSKIALELTKKKDDLYSTVGCHPTRCNEFEESGNPDTYLSNLIKLAKENPGKVVAIGECGLDYDRLNFCPKEVQKKYFERQLEMAQATGLPVFLHCRGAAEDLIEIIQRNRESFHNGVVHSFDGTPEEAKLILDQGLYIGINGCSLRTAANMETVKTIPSNRLMIETDCPWCEIKPTHAGASYVQTKFQSKKKEKWEKGFQVKGRNEPVNIIQVLEVLSAVRGEDIEMLAQATFDNTMNVFFPKPEASE